MLTTLTLSELLGTPVVDSTGAVSGRVREVALAPQDHPSHISVLIVRTPAGDRVLTTNSVTEVGRSVIRSSSRADEWQTFAGNEGFLLLDRDLMDQQIIDVHGRKVVRVNDVEFILDQTNGSSAWRVSQVEVGPRGAVRRLLKGIVPRRAVAALASQLSARAIPWDFVDLIEADPARRVKLRIDHVRLSRMHPADIADILEELAPAQREAIFETLDEGVAADALEEIDPKLQASLVESLESDHAADIVEEMDPDAAADLLENLSQETSEGILDEMEAEEREEVEELLEFREDTAAGRMTTEFVRVSPEATVEQAIDALRSYEGGVETISSIYLVEPDEKCLGSVPLSVIALAPPESKMASLIQGSMVSCKPGTSEKDVAELFDKYNLLTLPVIDEAGHISGVITADDVIGYLRDEL